jgi:dihydrofolate reductase
MRKLHVFDSISIDGFFTDAKGDMRWAHNPKPDPEWDAFGASNARGGGVLLFGRVTYEMMASFWPTAQAKASMPVVAERMNQLPKVVFSRTLGRADWTNTTVLPGDLATEVKKMKREPGDDLTILGSGSIVSQLTQLGLIDAYQIVVVPVILGRGRTLFEGVERRLGLKRTGSRSFDNGNVVMTYEPIA